MCAEANTENADSGAAAERWYLKKGDGSEYGPETLEVMARWAAESRVVSGNLMSRDGKDWRPVEQIPALAMDWTAQLPDGRKYGPFNIRATRDLHGHKVLPADTRLTRRGSDESVTVAEWLEREAARDQAPEASPAAAGAPLQAGAAKDQATAATNEQTAGEVEAAAAKAPRRRSRRRREDGAQGDLWGGEARAGLALDDGQPADGDERQARQASSEREGAEGEGEAARESAAVAAEETVEAGDAAEAVGFAVVAVDPPDDARGEESGLAVTPVLMDEQERTAPPAPVDPAAALLARIGDLEALSSVLQKQNKEIDSARQKAVNETERLRQTSNDAEEAHRAFLREAQAQAVAAEERSRAADAQKNETAERLTVAEQRLDVVAEELKTARADEARATAALRGAEAANQRKTQVYEKRIKDLLDERAGLTRLVEANAARIRGFRVGFAALLAIAVAAVLFAATSSWRNRPKTTVAVGARTESIASVAPARTLPTGKPVALPVIPSVPGIQIAYERGGCSVVFDAGVFSSATTLATPARQVLSRLVPHIKPYLGQYDLVIEGFSDNQPLPPGSRYASNADLAMARARAVAAFLSAEHGLPLASMRAAAGAIDRAPYSNGTEASRARNRTVVLRLVRHESR